MRIWDTAMDLAPLVVAPGVWTCMYYQYKYAGAFAYGVPVWLVIAAVGALAAVGAALARLLLSPDGRAETILVLIVLAGLLLEGVPMLLAYLLPRRYSH